MDGVAEKNRDVIKSDNQKFEFQLSHLPGNLSFLACKNKHKTYYDMAIVAIPFSPGYPDNYIKCIDTGGAQREEILKTW